MTGLDTNVLVRYLVQDDPKQSAAATRFIEGSLTALTPGFISTIVLCEVAWVLADCYGADKARIRKVIEGVLGTKQLVVEQVELVRAALRDWERANADFSDALIGLIATANGSLRTVTFDRAAAKLPGFELLA